MPRFALLVEYDGTAFSGWQRQAGQPSVQEALERALAPLAGGVPPTIQGAGRTDSGVHAEGQVAHVDLAREIAADKLADAVNYHLRPAPVAVRMAACVPDSFEARFSARARHYRYDIINRRADLALHRGRSWRVGTPLDADAMQQAAQALIGRHDFSTFRDSECQADSPVRTLSAMCVARDGDRITITCHAPSFLHRQVRSMVGSLVEVGRGYQPLGWIADILAAANRHRCGPVAPPDGLYLVRVDYEPDPFVSPNA
jgi:tRNA pseudouridine38-40 synthase